MSARDVEDALRVPAGDQEKQGRGPVQRGSEGCGFGQVGLLMPDAVRRAGRWSCSRDRRQLPACPGERPHERSPDIPGCSRHCDHHVLLWISTEQPQLRPRAAYRAAGYRPAPRAAARRCLPGDRAARRPAALRCGPAYPGALALMIVGAARQAGAAPSAEHRSRPAAVISRHRPRPGGDDVRARYLSRATSHIRGATGLGVTSGTSGAG
jgi:hypothetical protein